MTEFRDLSSWERQTLVRLCSESFGGNQDLCAQIPHVVVRTIDENGSLELKVSGGPKAEVRFRVPTEGEAFDDDEVMIHILLHVVDGLMSELEIFKEDHSSIRRRPEPSLMTVLVLD